MPVKPYACPHFRALIKAHLNGRSVRQVERESDLPENRIAHWMGRKDRLNEPPRIAICENIARGFPGLTPTDIWRALCQDAGLLPPEHGLSEQQVVRERIIEESGYGEIIDRMLAPFTADKAAAG